MHASRITERNRLRSEANTSYCRWVPVLKRPFYNYTTERTLRAVEDYTVYWTLLLVFCRSFFFPTSDVFDAQHFILYRRLTCPWYPDVSTTLTRGIRPAICRLLETRATFLSTRRRHAVFPLILRLSRNFWRALRLLVDTQPPELHAKTEAGM